MRAFSLLLERLAFTPSRNGKLKLLSDYVSNTPDPDRGWALAALADGLETKVSFRRFIANILVGRVDPVLFDLSREYVGDTAETVALLWPAPANVADPPRLSDVVQAVREVDKVSIEERVIGWLDRLDANGRLALLKLLTGGLRVGVSARLAKTALAQFGNVDVNAIEEVWHGVEAPYGDLFAWLEGRAAKPDISGSAVFRPLMLAHPLEEGDLEQFVAEDFVAEWKWDGIRIQISAMGEDVRLYSRAGDDIGKAFPDLLEAEWSNVVLDGELLVVRDGIVAPFNDLQQRLNRKTVSKRMLADFPAHVRFYDILIREGEDLRRQSLRERRAHLKDWFAEKTRARADLSETLEFETMEQLQTVWRETRANGIEGLMLKRSDSPYLAGRPKGHWFKWKRAPLTVDTVLMYAQRGSGKRSSFYSDFTFGTWRDTEDGRELVPVGKAYFGFTDDELQQLDRWVRNNTIDRFGPVRSVRPLLVVEVAFDAVHLSSRHKSGLAMRFPRIHRIRWDKPADEADRLHTLQAMIAT